MKREDQQDATIRCLIINFCLNMFRASLCPSSGEGNKTNYEDRKTNKMQQLDVSLLTSVSTCFGHHYAHLQEKETKQGMKIEKPARYNN